LIWNFRGQYHSPRRKRRALQRIIVYQWVKFRSELPRAGLIRKSVNCAMHTGHGCFSPHGSSGSGPMCRPLRVGKGFLHILQHWSERPCVWPVSAVRVTGPVLLTLFPRPISGGYHGGGAICSSHARADHL
jgi:hypothetical protein